jgi:hypothetical protein
MPLFDRIDLDPNRADGLQIIQRTISDGRILEIGE